MGTLANCEDLEEMQLIAAFYQGLYCLLRLKHPLGTKMHVHHNSEISTGDPLRYKMDNLSMYGKIHQNTKGLGNLNEMTSCVM